jgi:Domain of unknown function (DUF4123)
MELLAEQLNSILDGWLTDEPGSVCCVLESGGDDIAALLDIDAGREEGNSSLMRLNLRTAQLPSEMLPTLVQLTPKNWQLRQRTVEIALNDFDDRRAPRVCGWIASEGSAKTVATAFESSLLRTAPNGNRFLFRHHDPRVRGCLSALNGNRWMSSVVGSLSAWLFVGLDKLPMQTGSWSKDEAEREDSIRVHQAISRCEEINQAIELAREQGWSFQARAYGIADAALTRAEAFAFHGAADRLAYMLHALTLAPRFDAHPEIDAALRAARASSETYVDAMARVSAQTWQAAQAFAPTEVPTK